METKIEKFIGPFLKKDLPEIRPGDTVRVYQKIPVAVKKTKKKEEESQTKSEEERIQTFEGLVLAKKHGKGISAAITVRKEISGIGVEKIFPLHLPTIEKIEVVKRGKTRRAKLYYLRKAKGKK